MNTLILQAEIYPCSSIRRSGVQYKGGGRVSTLSLACASAAVLILPRSAVQTVLRKTQKLANITSSDCLLDFQSTVAL